MLLCSNHISTHISYKRNNKMSGGLMQIVAQGAQDRYLTKDPEITFFKSMHRRHTNFAIESIEQTFNGSVAGKRVSATISRNGDLVHTVWLEIEANGPVKAGTTIYDMIDKITVEIGGTKVDVHYGQWMKVYDDLTTSHMKRGGLGLMVNGNDTTNQIMRVPLSFWFCKDAGQALPLIALQYHEVKIIVDFTDMIGDSRANLYVDYIYLDTDERQRFARSSHEYLIEQVQTTGLETLVPGKKKKIRLNFNHPVKELVWVATNDEQASGDKRVDSVDTAKLQLNGHDRFSERDGNYFSQVQRYQYHTNAGEVPDGVAPGEDVAQKNDNIYSYSFALQPEDLQPSGTCNFSRIDNATLEIECNDKPVTSVTVYAVNYNVLRIKNGMGGLAYSN